MNILYIFKILSRISMNEDSQYLELNALLTNQTYNTKSSFRLPESSGILEHEKKKLKTTG